MQTGESRDLTSCFEREWGQACCWHSIGRGLGGVFGWAARGAGLKEGIR